MNPTATTSDSGMSHLVDCLQSCSFPKLSAGVQKSILLRGRPLPNLPRPYTYSKHSLPDYVSTKQLYQKHKWLTGCSLRRRFFCWPCLLMGRHEGGWDEWNVCGLPLSLFLPDLCRHEQSEKHVRAELQLQFFADRLLSSSSLSDDAVHNAHARRNKAILARVIDALCLRMLQRRRLRLTDPLTAEECVAALDLLARHGTHDADPSKEEDTALLLRDAPSYLAAVATSVASLLKQAIKKEAHGSAFASVVLTGHPMGEGSTPRILRSAVLRYVKGGKVCERYVGVSLDDSTSKQQLLDGLSRVFTDFQLTQRLVAVAVDGLCPFDISEDDIGLKYPYAKFMPCYFHGYWETLVQLLCCQVTNECVRSKTGSFFAMADSLLALVRRYGGEGRLSAALPALDGRRSTRDPVVLSWIKDHRQELAEFLQSPGQGWPEDDFARAPVLVEFLGRADTAYRLLFFIHLFGLTGAVNKMLDSAHPETLLVTGRLKEILAELNRWKDSGFPALWASVYMGQNLTETEHLRQQFCCTVALAVQFTWERLLHLRCLTFFKLLNPSNFFLSSFRTFQEARPLVFSLIENYDSGFSFELVEKELQDLYPDNRALLGFSIEQMLQYLTKYETRRRNYPNLIKLATLVLAMPCIKPSDGRTPVIQEIRAVVPSVSAPNIDFSVLYVENDLLEEIRLKPSFHDEVMAGLTHLH